jgi:hypothetical protein
MVEERGFGDTEIPDRCAGNRLIDLFVRCAKLDPSFVEQAIAETKTMFNHLTNIGDLDLG